MNIQIITSSYPAHPDDPTGTAGLFVRQFALELAARDHRVVVHPAGRKPVYEPDEGIAVLPSPWLGGDRELASMSLLNPLNWLIFAHFFLGGMRNTFRINRACAIDRTLCMWAVPSGIFGLAGKLVQGVPYDIWALGSDIWKIGRIPLIGRWLLRTVIRGADRVFADGRQLARDVEQLSGVRCAFLPSSRKLPLPAEKISLPEAGSTIHLLYIGRYHPNKGADLLMRALACLPDQLRESVRVDMYGFGPLREELERLVGALGLERCVTVNGPLAAQECATSLGSASFLVIPSRIESIPVVFTDALQSGTPVIATPVGDLAAIIGENGCGVVAGAVTPEALARAIGEATTRGRDSFREGIARAYAPLQLEQAVDTWLEYHDL